MHPHAELIEKFYTAFQKRDAKTMGDCYDIEAVFSDPVFPNLKGQEVAAMWRMLCSRGKDLTITFTVIEAGGENARAHWDAVYTFSATGRRVHNSIDAYFEFRNGKIVRHQDSFDLWKWTRMALGAKGWLLGWTPFVKNAVRNQAYRSLARFMEHENVS